MSWDRVLTKLPARNGYHGYHGAANTFGEEVCLMLSVFTFHVLWTFANNVSLLCVN